MAPSNNSCDCSKSCLEAVFEIPSETGISAIFKIDTWITKEAAEEFIEKYITPLQEGLAEETERAITAEGEITEDLNDLIDKVDVIGDDIINIQEELVKKVETITGDPLLDVSRAGSAVSIKSKTYEYEQGIPSDMWTITHNLDKSPSVSVVDSANEVQFPDEIIYNSTNSITLKFVAPFKGKAFLN